MWRDVALAAALGLGAVAAATRPVTGQDAIPRTSGWELVVSRCVICHSLEIATQQRLGPEGWAENVDRMITYGAPIPPEDRKVILDYLLRHFRDPDGR
jgi:cytochrome c2